MTKDDTIYEILGSAGRMICGSKTAYYQRHPDHRVFFNANLAVDGEICWHGDLDVDDAPTAAKLQQLADTLGKSVHVLREQPYRFTRPDPHKVRTGGLPPKDFVAFVPRKDAS